jgi:hypothetical protein
MGSLDDVMSGLLDRFDGNGGGDRSPLPYRERREFDRRDARVVRSGELHVRKLDAAGEAEGYELNVIGVVGRFADDTARQGPIQAALVARSIGRLDGTLETLDHRFCRELDNI